MKLSNVFYFKNIVDRYYPDENRPAVDIQSVVAVVKEDIKKLSDEDFRVLIVMIQNDEPIPIYPKGFQFFFLHQTASFTIIWNYFTQKNIL